MANLGSNDTAVKGDDFSLPAGAQLDEESGDLVIRDSGGNVVFRRDEAAGEWVGDSLNIDSLSLNAPVIGWDETDVAEGYDTISAAINDGATEIWYTEDIEDGNIPIPTGNIQNGLKIRGIGKPAIIDAHADGTPIFNADTSADSYYVTLENVYIDGNANETGRAIDANYESNGNICHRWTLRNCHFQRCAPAVILGADELTLDNVASIAEQSTDVEFGGTTTTMGAGLVHRGQSTAIRGGDYGNRTPDGEYGLRLITLRNFTINGTQVKHDDDGGTATAMVGFEGCQGGTVIALTSEGVSVDAPYDIDLLQGLTTSPTEDVDFFNTAVSAGQIKLTDCQDVEFSRPHGSAVDFVAQSAFNVKVQEGTFATSKSGSTSQNVLIKSGSNSDEPPQSGGTEELAAGEFQTQDDGKGLIVRTPDGTAQYRLRVDNSGNVVTDQL